MYPPRDFKSLAYASFATAAYKIDRKFRYNLSSPVHSNSSIYAEACTAIGQIRRAGHQSTINTNETTAIRVTSYRISHISASGYQCMIVLYLNYDDKSYPRKPLERFPVECNFDIRSLLPLTTSTSLRVTCSWTAVPINTHGLLSQSKRISTYIQNDPSGI